GSVLRQVDSGRPLLRFSELAGFRMGLVGLARQWSSRPPRGSARGSYPWTTVLFPAVTRPGGRNDLCDRGQQPRRTRLLRQGYPAIRALPERDLSYRCHVIPGRKMDYRARLPPAYIVAQPSRQW